MRREQPRRRHRTNHHTAHRAARRAVATVAAAVLALLATAGPASAASEHGNGMEIQPGQPFGGTTPAKEWVGSYLVGGKQVFCVRYQYKAPGTDEQYRTGDELLTKWGGKLAPETAANISYLLLRYGETKDNDEAAALAHLLHSWTSPSVAAGDLDPAKGFEEIAYDTDLHLARLPQSTKIAIDRLRSDAQANHGPWTTSVRAPEGEQTIGTPAGWTVAVRNADGKGVAKVPVRVTLTDATVDGKDSATVQTGADGTATVPVTPAGPNPKLLSTLSGPADKPYVREPVDAGANVQRVVSTGGEKELTAQAGVAAKPKPVPTTTVEVPRTIPAGDQPSAMVRGDTSTAPPGIGGLAALGGLAAAGSLLVGIAARRRWGKR